MLYSLWREGLVTNDFSFCGFKHINKSFELINTPYELLWRSTKHVRVQIDRVPVAWDIARFGYGVEVTYDNSPHHPARIFNEYLGI